jgi:cytochrome c peroxidase
LIAWSGLAQAEGAAPHMYVGAKKCKICHNSEKGGAQFRHWTESKHSKAFETLAGEKALAIAKEKGIADPQKADECLACHVTGHGKPADQFKPSFVAADGVGCESCHGPGADYMKKSVMQGIRDKTMKAEDYGLTMPTKETCAQCHNEKGTGGKFVSWTEDSTKIAHAIPPGYKRGAAAEGAEGE